MHSDKGVWNNYDFVAPKGVKLKNTAEVEEVKE